MYAVIIDATMNATVDVDWTAALQKSSVHKLHSTFTTETGDLLLHVSTVAFVGRW